MFCRETVSEHVARIEPPQFLCRGTVSEHVTRIEPAVNTLHCAAPTSHLILQPALLWQNALATSASVCKTIGRRPIPQNARLYYVNLAPFINSLMHQISFSSLLSACCAVVLSWLCNRQPPTMRNPPDAEILSMSSLAQSPSRFASMLSAFPDLGIKVSKSRVPLMYLTAFTNCLHDFRFGVMYRVVHTADLSNSGCSHGSSSLGPDCFSSFGIVDGHPSYPSSKAQIHDTCQGLAPTCPLRRNTKYVFLQEKAGYMMRTMYLVRTNKVTTVNVRCCKTVKRNTFPIREDWSGRFRKEGFASR